MPDSALIAKANNGDLAAQYQVANAFYLEKNYAEAKIRFETLATKERNNPNKGELLDPSGKISAINKLGIMHYAGYGFPEDAKESLKLFKEAAAMGSLSAEAHTAYLQFWGQGGLEKNTKQAMEKLTIFAKQGSVTAKSFLAGALVMDNNANKKQALDLMGEVIASPDATPAEREWSYFTLGNEFLDNKQYSQAMEYYGKAAELGYPIAMVYLSWIHLNKLDLTNNATQIEKNPELGFYYAMQAAQNGAKEGMSAVAYCYENGIGTTQSSQQARIWREKASQAKNVSTRTMSEGFPAFGRAIQNAKHVVQHAWGSISRQGSKEEKRSLLQGPINADTPTYTYAKDKHTHSSSSSSSSSGFSSGSSYATPDDTSATKKTR